MDLCHSPTSPLVNKRTPGKEGSFSGSLPKDLLRQHQRHPLLKSFWNFKGKVKMFMKVEFFFISLISSMAVGIPLTELPDNVSELQTEGYFTAEDDRSLSADNSSQSGCRISIFVSRRTSYVGYDSALKSICESEGGILPLFGPQELALLQDEGTQEGYWVGLAANDTEDHFQSAPSASFTPNIRNRSCSLWNTKERQVQSVSCHRSVPPPVLCGTQCLGTSGHSESPVPHPSILHTEGDSTTTQAFPEEDETF